MKISAPSFGSKAGPSWTGEKTDEWLSWKNKWTEDGRDGEGETKHIYVVCISRNKPTLPEYVNLYTVGDDGGKVKRTACNIKRQTKYTKAEEKTITWCLAL